MTAAEFEQRAKKMLYRLDFEDIEEQEGWLKILMASFQMGVSSRAHGGSLDHVPHRGNKSEKEKL